MRILIVTATASEVDFKGITCKKRCKPVTLTETFNHQVDLIVTGIGAVATAFYTTRFAEGYQFILNMGIAGSYSSDYPIGSVVCVKQDAFGDYGIDDRGVFKSLIENRLIDEDEKPYQGGVLINPNISKFPIKRTPLVNGITLATASGSIERIEQLRSIWNPDIETMESAAIFYVCSMLEIPFICIRSISNMVEPRDRSKWDLRMAITNLNAFTRNLINALPETL